jgi:hypothetical protein
MTSDPQVVSMNCLPTTGKQLCAWHTHSFDEWCLVADGSTTIGHAGIPHRAAPNTLFLFRRGERHGFWNTPIQKPSLWVIHFQMDPASYRGVDKLNSPKPEQRIWKLSPEQSTAYKNLFLNVSREHHSRKGGGSMAESAWLRLLMVSAFRWRDGKTSQPLPETSDPDLIGLWQAVNQCVRQSDGLRQLHRAVPNYDSLRHRFRKAFGQSPRAIVLNLRIQQAKNMLLETQLSIKEISDRLGYPRQHEFARAFSKKVGKSATAWRENPIDRRGKF